MVIEKEWPGKCAPLMRDRQPDEFALTFACDADYLKYAVQLPEGTDGACDAIGLVKGKHDYVLTVQRNGVGPTEVCLVVRNIPPRVRVGMRLDLKKAP